MRLLSLNIVILLIGVILGLVLGKLWLKLRKNKPPETPSDLVESEPSRKSKNILEIAEALEDPADQASHPKDLLEMEKFNEGVGFLSSPEFTSEDLGRYFTGANWLVSCIAAEAMKRGKQHESVIDRVLNHLQSVGAWQMFFILPFLSKHKVENLFCRVIINAKEWWTDSEPMKEMLGDLAEQTIKEDKSASFGPLLDDITAKNLSQIASFLKFLKIPSLTPLLQEIEQLQGTRIDKSYLETIGRIWLGPDKEYIVDHESMIEKVDVIVSRLTDDPPHSTLVIGESGVGKTVLIKKVAEHLQQDGWTIFEASATDVLAGQIYIGELEGRIKKMLSALSSGRKIIWYFPNFHELLYAGSHRRNPSSVLDKILPSIESGKIVVVGETTPEGYERLSQERKRLRSVIETFQVAPLGSEETLELTRKWIATQQPDAGKPVIDDPTLLEAFQLVRHHLIDKAQPGNLLNFIQLTMNRLKGASGELARVTLDDLLVSLSQLTGLPTTILDDRAELNLNELRKFFLDRVVGQDEAVDTLVERLAMLKAGMNDPTKPLGVFLFVGPTGTGKTEIAKRLAESLFGSQERMIRLDMSEYKSSNDLDRILGEQSENIKSKALVNEIRKQPFSVVLLDEFEKAHPNIWDLFLQVFDDGRLTDRAGNLADFRHSIIILTSNLGATIKSGPGIGFNPTTDSFSRSSVDKAVASTFRPEFINRIDRVVVFHPLNRNTMRKILHKELNEILQRRGFRNREWAVEWEDSAIEFLLNKGFTVDMGARPLKRGIEKFLLTPLSITIVDHEFPEGDQFLFVRSDGDKLAVEFIDPDAPLTQEVDKHDESSGTLQTRTIALDPQGSPKEMKFLEEQLLQLDTNIQSDEWTIKKNGALKKMSNADFWDSADRFNVLNEIEIMDRIESGLRGAQSLVNRLLGKNPGGRELYARNLLQRLAEQLLLLDVAYTDLIMEHPQDAYLRVETKVQAHGDSDAVRTFFNQIWEMYNKWARKRRMQAEVLQSTWEKDDTISGIIAISGFGAYTIIEKENGLHILETTKGRKTVPQCTVKVNVIPQQHQTFLGESERTEMVQNSFKKLQEKERPEIVRRYQKAPSPLVRDNARNFRTGRLNRVLEGDFDLIF